MLPWRTSLTWVLLVSGQIPLHAADQGPVFRGQNYLALLPAAGKPCRVELHSQQISKLYTDELQANLIGPDSAVVLQVRPALGQSQALSFAPKAGLHVLELSAGSNACTVDVADTPAAMVASQRVPMQTCRELQRLYFAVPQGCKRFQITLVAEAPAEGARLEVFAPAGETVVADEGNYDKPTAIRVDVSKGSDAKTWSLAVLRPKSREFHLDDVKLWLDPALPPYLALRADWAEQFGKRWTAK